MYFPKLWEPINLCGCVVRRYRLMVCGRHAQTRVSISQLFEIRSWSAAVIPAIAARETSAMAHISRICTKTLMSTWPHAWVPTPTQKGCSCRLLHVGPKKLAWRRARVSLTRSAAGPAALQAEPVAPWLAPMARSTDTVTDWLLCAGSGTSSMICCESR